MDSHEGSKSRRYRQTDTQAISNSATLPVIRRFHHIYNTEILQRLHDLKKFIFRDNSRDEAEGPVKGTPVLDLPRLFLGVNKLCLM